MEMLVTRQVFTDESTIGEMTIDGVHECFTLEDKVRDGERSSARRPSPPADTKSRSASPTISRRSSRS